MSQLNPLQPSEPWYRQRWPWILMAGPAVVIVAGFVTAFLAVTSWDGLVADDYYKEGLGVNQVKSRDQHAVESGISAEIMQSGRMVQLFLHGKPGVAFPATLKLRLVHPTRNGLDQSADLTQEGAGFYRGVFTKEPDGRFNAMLEDTSGEWRLSGEWKAGGEAPVILRAGEVNKPKS